MDQVNSTESSYGERRAAIYDGEERASKTPSGAQISLLTELTAVGHAFAVGGDADPSVARGWRQHLIGPQLLSTDHGALSAVLAIVPRVRAERNGTNQML